MNRTALKTLAAHKLRLALTTLAIVLGVAFVSGTLIFSDTISARFDTLFSDVYAGVDASVRPVQDDFGTAGSPDASFSEDVLAHVASVDGVDVAVPTVGGVARIIDRDGQPIGGQGPPTIGGSWVEPPAISALRIEDGNGHAPRTSGEVVIDVATATGHDFVVGDRVDVEVATGAETFTIVGLANFGTEDNLAGATLAFFELEEAQRVLGLQGRLTQIDVIATTDVTADVLTDRLGAALPDGLEAVTGDQQTREQLDAITTDLGFLSTALLAFAAVAVFVGGFMIHNTFRIIVAQRTRELALLRALGATRRQVRGLVAVEALVIGFLASIVGVVVGLGFSVLLKAGMDAAGLGTPDGPLTVLPRTVIVGLLVGTVVTLVSALVPARKAAGIPPVAAMRDIASTPASMRGRAITGLVLVLGGGVAIVAALRVGGGSSLALVGLNAVLVFVGVSVLAPLFARPIAGLLGSPIRGLTGQLARENTRRQPRRTAATASALMIGVALVGFVSILGASVKATAADTLAQAFQADLAIVSPTTGTVSEHALAELAEVDEIATLSAVRTGLLRVDGQERNVAGIDHATIGQVYAMDASIELSELGTGVLVQEELLAESGWAVGDVVAIQYPRVGTVDTEIVGTFADQTFANLVLADGTFRERVHDADPMMALARLAEGVGVADGRSAASTALAAHPSIDVTTGSEQVAQAEAQIDQLLVLFTGLLGLAILIAVVGIANTLALSIVERTREIGLLRAVGMPRRGIRRMVRWEGVITALFGALLGLVLGVALGWVVVASLADEGLGTFSIPAAQLAIWLVVAGAAGMVAAIGPARRASRLPILEALAKPG